MLHGVLGQCVLLVVSVCLFLLVRRSVRATLFGYFAFVGSLTFWSWATQVEAGRHMCGICICCLFLRFGSWGTLGWSWPVYVGEFVSVVWICHLGVAGLWVGAGQYMWGICLCGLSDILVLGDSG